MRPPASRVTLGSDATGYTSSDEPTHTIRSASAASAYARLIASSGSISPNSTTSGFRGVMHAGHSGAPGRPAGIPTTRWSDARPPHSGHTLHSIDPCTSITFDDPATL